jgi:hypothetical protein
MQINEVVDSSNTQLLALSQFLLGRAEDTNGEKQISQDAFLNLAHNMGIPLTPETLADKASQPPLNGVLLPIEPNSGVVKFKGNDSQSVAMPVNKAQDIVASAAKSAMKRGMK